MEAFAAVITAARCTSDRKLTAPDRQRQQDQRPMTGGVGRDAQGGGEGVRQHHFIETLFPSLISLVVSVDVKHHVYLLRRCGRAQELCESGGGRPGLPSLISLLFLWT